MSFSVGEIKLATNAFLGFQSLHIFKYICLTNLSCWFLSPLISLKIFLTVSYSFPSILMPSWIKRWTSWSLLGNAEFAYHWLELFWTDNNYLLDPLHVCPLWDIKQQQSSLHLALFCTACFASPHVSFTSLSSAMTVWLFGRPGFLLPGGVWCRTTLGIQVGSILSMWSF